MFYLGAEGQSGGRPDQLNFYLGDRKNSYFVAPGKEGAQSNQQATFPPTRK